MIENKNNVALKICGNFARKENSKTIFSFVSKDVFVQSLVELIKSKGDKLYQSKNTCGIAAIMHLSAKNDISAFVKFATQLYSFGFGCLNGYEISKEHNLIKWAATVKPNEQFDGVSLVVIGSIRFVENGGLRFNQGTIDGMTWPGEIWFLSKKIFKGVLFPKTSFFLAWNLNSLKKVLDQKYEVILLYRTSAWKNNGNLFKDAWHYIVLKKIDFVNKMLKITYWDYGEEKSVLLNKTQFLNSVIKTFVFKRK